MSDFDEWRKQRECKRHTQHKTLKIAAQKRSAFHGTHNRPAYIWKCDICGFYHLSKIKKDTKLHKTALNVNKQGELVTE